MKKAYVAMTAIYLVTACTETTDRVNNKIDLLRTKANELDSIINAEANHIEKLDSIIYYEMKKVQQLDSIIEAEKKKW